MAQKLNPVTDFLVMKSTEQQKREGIDQPVDTAYVKEINGKLMLIAVFDVHHFKPDDIIIKVNNGQLSLTAKCDDDTEDAIYRKTMLRTLDLPEYADDTGMHYSITEGVLTVEMPLILPQKPKPISPTVVPITVDDNGRRKICIQFMIGLDFTVDDLKVVTSGHDLYITASYEAEIGMSGQQTTRHELKRNFRLPENISVGEVSYELHSDGNLHIEIMLNDEPSTLHYRCSVTTEDVTADGLNVDKT